MKVTKEFKWEMAHKLEHSYTSKCRDIHGHSYRAYVTLKNSKNRLPDGVVVDFTQVKEVLSPVIDMLDHSLLLKESDATTAAFRDSKTLAKLNVLTMVAEPTAESIAGYLFCEAVERLKKFENISVSKVEVFETATSSATCTQYYPAFTNAVTKLKGD